MSALTTVFQAVDVNGVVSQERFVDGEEEEQVEQIQRLRSRSLVSLSVVSGTSADSLYLRGNLFAALPDAAFQLPRMNWINMQVNRLETLAGVGRLTALTTLYVWLLLFAVVLLLTICLQLCGNCLASLPSEIGHLRSLEILTLSQNRLVSVPAELGCLPLCDLRLDRNRLPWVPLGLGGLPQTTHIELWDNPLAVELAWFKNNRARLQELFAATTHIGMIRERATEVCLALQDLELPAVVTLEIVCLNDIRMWAKWELITAVKHFRGCRGIREERAL
jgi:Leucine-rich repeat (LRR) protein